MTNGRDGRPLSTGVFISYRRGETNGQARALHDLLAQQLDPRTIFMDVDSVAPGADFVQKIEDAIASSGVALVLIGHDWLSRGPGPRLLDDTGDFVRMEIEIAMKHAIPIVPILVERTPMPAPGELPESLRSLTRRNALELENQRWEYDVSRLLNAVKQYLATGDSAGPRDGLSSPSQAAEREGEPRRGDDGHDLANKSDLLAKAIHDDYVRRRPAESRLANDDPALASWEDLPEPLRRSNHAQAADIGHKLDAIGCEIVQNDGESAALQLTPEEVERLARMEHDRWSEERLRDGWRYGPERDLAAKLSPGLVPWDELSEELRDLDRDAVRAIPELLASAGLSVARRRD